MQFAEVGPRPPQNDAAMPNHQRRGITYSRQIKASRRDINNPAPLSRRGRNRRLNSLSIWPIIVSFSSEISDINIGPSTWGIERSDR